MTAFFDENWEVTSISIISSRDDKSMAFCRPITGMTIGLFDKRESLLGSYRHADWGCQNFMEIT